MELPKGQMDDNLLKMLGAGALGGIVRGFTDRLTGRADENESFWKFTTRMMACCVVGLGVGAPAAIFFINTVIKDPETRHMLMVPLSVVMGIVSKEIVEKLIVVVRKKKLDVK